MPTEIAALIDKPHLLIAVLFVGAVIGMGVEQALTKLQRRRWRQKGQYGGQQAGFGKIYGFPSSTQPEQVHSRQHDAADQLRVVMGASFSSQPLLNRSEARVFKELDRIVLECRPGWQVMAQVSLGEILRCKDSDAYRCINSKRVDLLIVDEDCQPRHAVEYQGGGHHQGTAAARDAVKKEALRRAGIGYHEVVAGRTTPSELRQLVTKLVGSPAAVGSQVASQ